MTVKKNNLTLALVAHDNMKKDLAAWVEWNWEALLQCHLVCTGTTGKMVEKTLAERRGESVEEMANITLLKSGPLGGDQMLGAMIAQNQIDAMFFFWDPMQAQPHDVDVKALLRLATLYNVPTAFNRSTADYIISSPLFGNENYTPEVRDYANYIQRSWDGAKEAPELPGKKRRYSKPKK